MRLERFSQFVAQLAARGIAALAEPGREDGRSADPEADRVLEQCDGALLRNKNREMIGGFGETVQIGVTCTTPDRFAIWIDRKHRPGKTESTQVTPYSL